jgi:hypothetical protein
MSLDPRARAELEKRGPKNVRAMLDAIAASGGERAFIRLGITDCPDPRPYEVEIWLREKETELEADKLSASRHEEQLTGARGDLVGESRVLGRTCLRTGGDHLRYSRPSSQMGLTECAKKPRQDGEPKRGEDAERREGDSRRVRLTLSRQQ